MMLPCVVWIAIWQAMYDPRLWIGAGSGATFIWNPSSPALA
jgi:hypothetical protein